jgi:hypothetical protein
MGMIVTVPVAVIVGLMLRHGFVQFSRDDGPGSAPKRIK